MDVLSLIKSDRDQIRRLLGTVEESQPTSSAQEALKALDRELRIHLKLEEEYLYPEVSGLFADSEALIAQCKANQEQVSRCLDEAMGRLPKGKARNLEKILQDLRLGVSKHFYVEDEMLVPKIRAHLPTSEREELGKMFLDLKAEHA